MEKFSFVTVLYETPWGVRLGFVVLNRLNLLWMKFRVLFFEIYMEDNVYANF